MVQADSQKQAVILFDGVCNFCNYWVNFILKHDKKGHFRFAPLQSEAGKALLQQHQLNGPAAPDSVILIQNGKAYIRSAAAFRIASQLNGGWKWLGLLRFLPRKLSDFFYSVVARNRYKWFGKKEACMIPEPGWKDRFLI